MMADSPVSVFISYSRTDSSFVDRLEADLRGYGFNTWVDRQHLEGGVDWARLIEQQISKCDVLVVSLSPDAVASQWVQNEIVYAQSAGKHIIPVITRPVERVPIEIIRLQFIDLRADYANRLQELRVALLKVSSFPSMLRPTQAPQSLLAMPDVSDPLKGLVQIPPTPPAPNPDLMAILRQAQSALAHGELDLAEALLQQVVAQEKGFGNGLAAEELQRVREQLAPIQLQRLRTVADQAHIQGAWGQEIGALRALIGRLPEDIELRDRLALAEDCQTWSFLYDTACEFAQIGDTDATSRTLAQLWTKAPYFGDPTHIAPKGLQATTGTQSIRELRLRTMPAGHLLSKIRAQNKVIENLSWSPDGSMLASVERTYGTEFDIHVWESDKWKRISTLPCWGNVPRYLVWSPDSTGLVCPSEQGYHVRRVPDGDVAYTLLLFPAAINSIAGNSAPVDMLWTQGTQRTGAILYVNARGCLINGESETCTEIMTQENVRRFDGSAEPFNWIKLSPNGKAIAFIFTRASNSNSTSWGSHSSAKANAYVMFYAESAIDQGRVRSEEPGDHVQNKGIIARFRESRKQGRGTSITPPVVTASRWPFPIMCYVATHWRQLALHGHQQAIRSLLALSTGSLLLTSPTRYRDLWLGCHALAIQAQYLS